MVELAGEFLTWEIKSIIGNTGLTHITMRANCTCGQKLEAWHDDFRAKCTSCGTVWQIPADVQNKARGLHYDQLFAAAGVRAAAGGSGAMIPI